MSGFVPIRSDIPNATVAWGSPSSSPCLRDRYEDHRRDLGNSAAVCFDVFFTQPYGLTLHIPSPRCRDQCPSCSSAASSSDAVGAQPGNIVGWSRRTSYDLSRIHAVAEMLASGRAWTGRARRGLRTQDLLGLQDLLVRGNSFLMSPGPSSSQRVRSPDRLPGAHDRSDVAALDSLRPSLKRLDPTYSHTAASAVAQRRATLKPLGESSPCTGGQDPSTRRVGEPASGGPPG